MFLTASVFSIIIICKPVVSSVRTKTVVEGCTVQRSIIYLKLWGVTSFSPFTLHVTCHTAANVSLLNKVSRLIINVPPLRRIFSQQLSSQMLKILKTLCSGMQYGGIYFCTSWMSTFVRGQYCLVYILISDRRYHKWALALQIARLFGSLNAWHNRLSFLSPSLVYLPFVNYQWTIFLNNSFHWCKFKTNCSVKAQWWINQHLIVSLFKKNPHTLNWQLS